MAAKFTPKIRTFMASSLIDNIALQQVDEWESLKLYVEGTVVYYGNSKYISKETGTSGIIAPTHISGTASDGSIDWIWVETISTNQMFKRNVFVSIGKNTVWDDELIPDDAGIADIDDYETFQNFMTLKRVTSSNFRLGIRRYNWTPGTVYSSYDHSKDPIAISGPESYEHPFYILTDENNIYKCIDNNNDALSMSKPTSTGSTSEILADGYVWKYMGSLDSDSVFYLTEDYIPVKYKIFDDGSNQWDVQQSAAAGSLSSFRILNSTGTFPALISVSITGGNPTTPAQAIATKVDVSNTLNQILVDPTEIGEGYEQTESVIAIAQKSTAVGSGGTVGDITVVNGVITNIDVGNAGSDYSGGAILILVEPTGTVVTEAVVTVDITVGNNIQQFVIQSGGSGYTSDVQGYVIPGNAGGVAEAIFAPKSGHGHNIVTELCANTAIINMRLSESSQYLQIGEQNSFRQVCLVTDVVEKDTLETAYQQSYIGPSHPLYGLGTINEIDSLQGYVLYINNLTKVVRSSGQEENINICVTF